MVSSSGNALSLIRTVLELVADQRTGVLEVTADGLRTRLFFSDGRPLFAEDDAPGETFGRLLMRQGVLSNDRFLMVIDEMTRAASGNNQLRFGEVAVGLGFLTSEQVERGLAEQICGIIARSLQRGESQWAFESAPGAMKPPRSFSLQINPVVAAALRDMPDRAKVADIVARHPEEFVVVAGLRPDSGAQDEAGGAGAETRAARMAAEQAFQKGVALLRDGKTVFAAIELRRAADLQPESLEYLLYATWAKARSYREIPSPSDQQTLLEIAQRAKRRDPMFAFGSYVMGQIAMWADDEAAAKKWFYEALRLDPTSEAAKQVRVLARRGTGVAVGAGAEVSVPADRTATAEPAPALVAEAPVQALPGASPVTPSGGWGKRVATGAALLATAGLVILAVARKSAPSMESHPYLSAPPALSVDASPRGDSERQEISSALSGIGGSPAASAGPAQKAAETAGEKSRDAQTGTVLLPARASGHRIFVDGHRAKTDGTAPFHLRCGQHVVQIGSAGSPEPIDLPCGGEVQLQ